MMDLAVRISYHEELAKAATDPAEKARQETAAQLYRDMLKGAEQATAQDAATDAATGRPIRPTRSHAYHRRRQHGR